MQDTSFIDLISDENLKKMSIDERLLPAFSVAMKDMQKYFNYMGYTKSRNYKEFFDNFFIHKYYKTKIKCKRNLSACSGCYKIADRIIYVDESILDFKTNTIKVLIHEFIHFLVMQNVRSKNIVKNSIIHDGFIDEALTEMLTMRILPLDYQAYTEQINMLKFWYLLNDKEINFEEFLNEGKVSGMTLDVREIFDDYQNFLEESDEDVEESKKNKKYVFVQRYLIKSLDINIDSIEKYEKLIFKLSNRPVEDNGFMIKFYRLIENNLADNLNITDNNIRNRFMYFIKKYRVLAEYLSNNKTNRFISRFKCSNELHELDARKNLYINGQFNSKGDYLQIFDDDDFTINIKYERLREIKNKQKKRLKELNKNKERIKDILKYIVFISDNISEEIKQDDKKILIK